MATIHDVCDYIIVKLVEAGELPSVLKVQKLLYYVQAWNLAIEDEPLFDGKFQAWVHGPVSREIYDRFVKTKYMYSSLNTEDCLGGQDNLGENERVAVDDVLDVYAGLSGSQLEDMTHQEDPWLHARNGLPDSARCEVEIDESLMQRFYAKRLS